MSPDRTCRISSTCFAALIGLAAASLPPLEAQAVQPAWVARGDPFARRDTALAHDAGRGVTIMFGGSTPFVDDGTTAAGPLGDTWAWDGSRWEQRRPPSSPPARVLPAMAYDPARGRIVLFGGEGATGVLRDTWEWDGSTWHRMLAALSPPARRYPAMVYDAGSQRTLLFSADRESRDLWEWDGQD